MSDLENHPVLLFDGVCNFCNRWINFIIRKDKKKKFRFAALQSKAGKQLLKNSELDEAPNSVVLLFKGKVYVKSAAALQVFYHIGGVYAMLFAFIIFPTYVRDFYYDIIAKNRYKWWGKKESCMIPTQEIRDRFIEK
jgi:predicted DCC family thiol-disulfide oxidoreductase YuxK